MDHKKVPQWATLTASVMESRSVDSLGIRKVRQSVAASALLRNCSNFDAMGERKI
jgi:hypothetical protein